MVFPSLWMGSGPDEDARSNNPQKTKLCFGPKLQKGVRGEEAQYSYGLSTPMCVYKL